MGDWELVINPATGDWLLLSEAGKRAFLDAAEGMDEALLQRRNPSLSGEELEGLLNALERCDFVSQQDCGRSHTVRDCHAGQFPRLAVLKLTEACNLKCSYCYVGAGEGQTAMMKPETAFRIVDEYLAMNPEENVTILLHGGEPLLHYDLVQKLVEYAEPYRDRLALSIQTNATLLTRERVRFLKEHNLGVGVSLEGPPELHDRTRPLQSGESSFAATMRGIRLLREEDCPFGNITVLTRKCAENIEAVFDFFLEQHIYYFSISPFQPIARGAKDTDNFVTPELLFEAYKRLIDRIVAHNQRHEPSEWVSERLLTNWARKIFLNEYGFMCTHAPCGAGRDVLGFDVNGDYYLCDDFIHDPEFLVGRLEDGPIRDRLLETDLIQKRCDRSMAKLPRCRACVWRSLCSGVCCSTDHYSGAEGRAETVMCGFYQRIIPYLIQLSAQIPELPELLCAEPRRRPPRKLFAALSNREDERLNGGEFSALLKLHAAAQYDTVFLCGDEPTENPELPMLLRAACRLNVRTVLVTDGLRLGEEAWLRELFASGLQRVWIQLPAEPAKGKALAEALSVFFRVRRELGARFSALTLRAEAEAPDAFPLSILEGLRKGDQLRVAGTLPRRPESEEPSPLRRALAALREAGMLASESGAARSSGPREAADASVPPEGEETLLWIDARDFSGRELSAFPDRLLNQ